MRTPVLTAALAAAALSACATKPLPVATGCTPMGPVQMVTIIEDGLGRALGPNKKGHHALREDLTEDARGYKVLTLKQIGISEEPQPGPGEGARAVIVYNPCTAEVISARRL